MVSKNLHATSYVGKRDYDVTIESVCRNGYQFRNCSRGEKEKYIPSRSNKSFVERFREIGSCKGFIYKYSSYLEVSLGSTYLQSE